MSTIKINLRINTKLLARLDSHCVRTQQTRTSVIVQSVIDTLRTYDTEYKNNDRTYTRTKH